MYFFCYINKNSHYLMRFVKKKGPIPSTHELGAGLFHQQEQGAPFSFACLQGTHSSRAAPRHAGGVISVL